jgi:4-oxalocrotonate tautomerase
MLLSEWFRLNIGCYYICVWRWILMPVVHVYMWAGRSQEVKEKIVKGITDVFVNLGVPAEAVTVILHDVEKSNWGSAGKLASKTS